MNTDSRRKASATYHAKREAEGLKKVTLWLGPAARDKLDALKGEAGSKDKAAELAIMAYGQKSKRAALDARAAQQVAETWGKPALNIQVGPVERKPGAMLKGPKK